jgi:hypothetical protein
MSNHKCSECWITVVNTPNTMCAECAQEAAAFYAAKPQWLTPQIAERLLASLGDCGLCGGSCHC